MTSGMGGGGRDIDLADEYWKLEAHVGVFVVTWLGGEYADVWDREQYVLRPLDRTSFAVINMWDYQSGKPRIEPSAEAFFQEVKSWVSDLQATEENQ